MAGNNGFPRVPQQRQATLRPPPSAKPAKRHYRRNLPHIQPPGRRLFVTFCTLARWTLPESVRGVVLNHCLHDDLVKLWMHGLVVMPDHVHLVFTPLADQAGATFGLAEIMKGMKGASSRSINIVLNRRGHAWEEESFDHVLRSDESTVAKVEYICQNPVREGLVGTVDEYPWLWREWIEGRRDGRRE